MTIDIGTGDGRAALQMASREPSTLILGLDASAAAMAERSRRAARPARKGGYPNVRFVVAAAEVPPAALVGAAELVTVRFPWASLLRGCLGLDARVADGVAALVKDGGRLELLLAPSARDNLGGVPTDPVEIVAAAARTFGALGFRLIVGRVATASDIEASGSTWAKRLAAGQRREPRDGNGHADRSVTLVRLDRLGRSAVDR